MLGCWCHKRKSHPRKALLVYYSSRDRNSTDETSSQAEQQNTHVVAPTHIRSVRDSFSVMRKSLSGKKESTREGHKRLVLPLFPCPTYVGMYAVNGQDNPFRSRVLQGAGSEYPKQTKSYSNTRHIATTYGVDGGCAPPVLRCAGAD